MSTVVLAVAGCSNDGDSGNDSNDGKDKKESSEQTPDKPESALADKSGHDVAEMAMEAMKSVDSMSMNGDLTVDGDDLKMKLAANTDGECTGDIGAPEMGNIDLIKTSSVVYMKGDETFINTLSGGDAEAAKLFRGKWLKTTDTKGADGLDNACDLSKMLGDFEGPDSSDEITKGEPTSLDGQQAIPLSGSDKDDGGTYTLYVADDAEKPYVLKMEKKDGDDPGTVTFSDFDKPLNLNPPPADQTVDMDKLKDQKD